jgi:2',3'-cyclic-nucleotide 2'-phosphodiesterase (5'-nucleotidase family)
MKPFYKHSFLIIIISVLGAYSCKLKSLNNKTVILKQAEHPSIIAAVADSAQKDTYQDLLTPYRLKMDSQMNVIVGNITEELKKDKPNGGLNNLVCDAMLWKANLKISGDMCFQNYGGIRIPSVSKGPITLGKIYEIMPFDNELVALQVTGSIVDSLCQLSAQSGGWPMAGISYTLQNNKATNIQIKNKGALQYDANYTLIANDYIANGGDKCSFLKSIPQQSLNVLVRDALIKYIQHCSNTNTALIQEPFIRINK